MNYYLSMMSQNMNGTLLALVLLLSCSSLSHHRGEKILSSDGTSPPSEGFHSSKLCIQMSYFWNGLHPTGQVSGGFVF